MQNSPFEDLHKKDFLTALKLWVAIEVISFWFLPTLQPIEAESRMRLWMVISVPLGLGGAVLIAASSQFVAHTGYLAKGGGKKLLSTVGQFAGLFGLTGVLFPLIVVTIELMSQRTSG